MMTAVDTCVLLDVFYAPSEHAEASAAALRRAYDDGGLCIALAVYAELAPRFESREVLDTALREVSIVLLPDTPEVAWLAGRCWAAYRADGGTRTRILTDFLIAAHAATHADRLLTRDRGFYQPYFGQLKVIEP